MKQNVLRKLIKTSFAQNRSSLVLTGIRSNLNNSVKDSNLRKYGFYYFEIKCRVWL